MEEKRRANAMDEGFRCCSAFRTSGRLSTSPYHYCWFGEIADDFFNSCPNVKSLSIRDKRALWVTIFGEQLEELETTAETPSAIANCCRNLRELTLFLEDFDPDEMDTDLWETVGSRLRCLSLSAMYPEDVGLENFKTHCANLRRISMGQMKSQNEEVSHLLASYGDQFEYCEIEEMNERELTPITTACKNVRFSASLPAKNGLSRSLQILGGLLEKITVTY